MPKFDIKEARISGLTWIGSSDGWGRAKGWTNRANCMPDVFRRSEVQGIWKKKKKKDKRMPLNKSKQINIW